VGGHRFFSMGATQPLAAILFELALIAF